MVSKELLAGKIYNDFLVLALLRKSITVWRFLECYDQVLWNMLRSYFVFLNVINIIYVKTLWVSNALLAEPNKYLLYSRTNRYIQHCASTKHLWYVPISMSLHAWKNSRSVGIIHLIITYIIIYKFHSSQLLIFFFVMILVCRSSGINVSWVWCPDIIIKSKNSEKIPAFRHCQIRNT